MKSIKKKSDWPRVSVIIPVYNREWCIGNCLASICKQEYPKGKIEVLVVDAGSSDKTLEIARRYPVRIISNTFVKDLIFPFLDDPEIAGSFTRYLPAKKQNAFNRFVSYHELQLWPMLAYLVPQIKDVKVAKRKKYDVVEIDT